MNDSMNSTFKSARELGRSRLILKKQSTRFFFFQKNVLFAKHLENSYVRPETAWATHLQNPVIGAIFLAWDLDGREREGEKSYVEVYLAPPPVEPTQTLFSAFFFFFSLFPVFLFPIELLYQISDFLFWTKVTNP